MRKIEFRVRDSDTKKIIGYEFFNVSFNSGFMWTDASEPREERICKSEHSERPMLDPISPLGHLLREQYTGLKDENGVKIFEGDIVRWGGDVIEAVFYSEQETAFLTETSCLDKCMEVIGNIHQNPELLENNHE